MTSRNYLQSPLLIFGIPLLLLLSCLLLALYSGFSANQNFIHALTADFVLIIPLIYLLLIRKTKIPTITVVPVFIVGILVASYALPPEHQDALGLVKTWILPGVELTVLSSVVLKFRSFSRALKKEKQKTTDLFLAFEKAANQSFPYTVAKVVAFEFSTFYFTFFHWKRKKLLPNEYSGYKNSGTIPLLYGLILVLIVETVALHFLLNRWSIVFAWIATLFSLYSLIQVFGLIKTLPLRPTLFAQDRVHVKFGILGEAEIPLENIDQINTSKWDFDQEELKGQKIGLVAFNVCLKLKHPVTVKKLYGFTKTSDQIAFYVDNLEEFTQQIGEKIS